MRAYRFVEFLGSTVAGAGQAVAEAAHVEFDHSGGLAATGADTPSERVGHELLRQIAREIDASERGDVTFTARALAPVQPEKRATRSPGGEVGFVFQADLPGYTHTSGLVGTTVYAPALAAGAGDWDGEDVQARLGDRLEATPAVYLLLVEDAGVRVMSGHGVTGITDPVTRTALTDILYAKSLGRFAQEFAEGFLGDPRLVDSFEYPDRTDDLDGELRDWATDNDLQGAVLIRASLAPNREPASLRDFY